MKKLGLLGLASLALAACSDHPLPVAPPVPHAPGAIAPSRSARIAGRYIVVFKPGTNVDAEAPRIAARRGGRIRHTYHAALRGMAIELPDAAAAALAQEPNVASVEQDQVISINTTETGATWGIDRVDQRALPLSSTYDYGADGTGVTVYIIDTGIDFSHVEFGGRASPGIDEVTAGGSAADCNGHGTHVSGTVGGATYGIAKNVKLVAVRVLDCSGSGTISGVIAGIDWVTANHATPAAANMSLGGGLSSVLNQAVENSIAAGIVYAVAAGNSSADACYTSPASAPDAITVGATDYTDGFAYFSNYGSCVDLNAPGVSITSAWNTSNTATNTISGTSMATPHVTGAAALYLQANPTATPADVATALTGNATPNVIANIGAGTPNLLLYTSFVTVAPPAPPPATPPVASFTFTCSSLSCSFDGSGSTSLSSATYGWDFGDGSSGSGSTASHAFAAAGSYQVTLTVTDTNGMGTQTQTVTVAAPPPPPVASFTYSCRSRTCSFDASGTTDATSYAWSFGDGTTGSGVTVSHSFAPRASYTVTLTATGAGGSGTTSRTITCTRKYCN